MPRIVISLTDGQKDVWVAAAHDERVTLSEWVRRAADARAGRFVTPELERDEVAAVRREFRGPDPKGGRRGLGSGEVPAAGSPPVAGAAVSPEPSFRPDPKKKP